MDGWTVAVLPWYANRLGDEEWRIDCNTIRPPQSPGYLTLPTSSKLDRDLERS